MSVRNLVGLYDSPSTRSSGQQIQASRPKTSESRSQTSSSRPTGPRSSGQPVPAYARFIQHQTRQISPRQTYEESEGLPFTPSNDFTTTTNASTEGGPNAEADVTDELPMEPIRMNSYNSSIRDHLDLKSSLKRRQPSGQDDEDPLEYEARSLLSETDRSHTFDDSTVVASDSAHKPLLLPIAERRGGPVAVPHTPVPAVKVFSRRAAALYLPALDSYLASLPSPEFSTYPYDSSNKDLPVMMFPPMDRLAATGRTLEDLETNSTIPPWWRNRNSLFGAITSRILGTLGSSALASFYSLQGLLNTIQVFALILSTIVPRSGEHLLDKWRQLFLGTIPNILAFNFASTLVEAMIFLVAFMSIAALLLYWFFRSTSGYLALGQLEGLRQQFPQGRSWGLVIVTFLLTFIYLPLSTMAVHVLVWSQDLWVVPNPYINATSSPPVVPPLGPPDEYRDPLDFCYTTTMRKDDVNYAPIFVILAVVVFASLTVWFPLRLRQVILRSTPAVDRFNELGKLRTASDMDREYQRLIDRDRGPFAFLYKGFRRGWGTYESTYLLAKLSTLIIIAFIDPDNCVFRTLSRSTIGVTRQALLLITMVAFFVLQCITAPFMDPAGNASEFISRVNYVATAALSLAVVLNVPGQAILEGPVLYIIYIITYGLGVYFTLIDLSVMQRAVKRLLRRVDFSIDIFSPRLDISPSSVHTRRRIWQESITTLFMTSPDCAISKTQNMTFAQAPDAQYPPYLLDFSGSPSERHVENLKILREVGLSSYNKAVALVYGPDTTWFRTLEAQIQDHFVGPDCYWKSPTEKINPGYTKFFGNGWWIPFPPTLVIHMDDGPLVTLKDVADLQSFVAQNSSHEIQRKRQIRMALRALDGKLITWPYEYIKPVGAHEPCCCGGRRYKAQTSQSYRHGVLRIKHRGNMMWQDVQLGSGLDVEIRYDRDVTVDGTVIGLNDEYDLTGALARFLALNESLIPESLAYIGAIIDDYRKQQKQGCRHKADVLSYRFLAFVYNQPRDPIGLAESSITLEKDLRVRQLMVGNEQVFEVAYERLSVVGSSEAATWWYIFWDDVWRRNNDVISAMRLHASDFDPHYPTSIAYHPLPRPALENFLTQRGIFHNKSRWRDFIYSGLLNKLYLRLNEIVFQGSSKVVRLHLGDDSSELDMEQIDVETLAGPSSLGTGGGTDHDDASIRARPTYRWEGLLSDPLRRDKRWKRRWFAKFGAWFGVTNLWRSGMPSRGISLDVRLENGRYVVMDSTD